MFKFHRYKKRKRSHEFFENELYVAMCEGGYFCSTTSREGDTKNVESKYISYDDAYTFVMDGPNIILLRYLALTRFEGKLTTTYMDMSGHIGESSYVSPLNHSFLYVGIFQFRVTRDKRKSHCHLVIRG